MGNPETPSRKLDCLRGQLPSGAPRESLKFCVFISSKVEKRGNDSDLPRRSAVNKAS